MDMEKLEKTIAKNMTYFRKLNGLTAEEMASYLGVTRQSIYDMEAQRTKLSLTRAIKFCELHGIQIDNLISEDFTDCLKDKTRFDGLVHKIKVSKFSEKLEAINEIFNSAKGVNRFYLLKRILSCMSKVEKFKLVKVIMNEEIKRK